MQRSFTLATIGEIATMFWKNAGTATVFAFHGDMGAGKTTLIHALCAAKGVKEPVTSPTFSLINEYHYFEDGQERKILHLDLYRLKDEEEAVRAGVEDCFYSGDICLVEWPERAPGLFPPGTVQVYLQTTGAGNRNLLVENK